VPTGPEQAYNDALIQARRVGFKIGARGLNAADAVFDNAMEALADIGSVFPGRAPMTAEIGRELDALWRDYSRGIGTATNASTRLLIDDVLEEHSRVLAQIAGLEPNRTPQGFVGRLGGANVRAYAVIAARDANAANLRTLVNRGMGSKFAALDTLIESSVLRGIGAGEFTFDVANFLQADQKILAKWPSTSKLHRGGFGTLDYSKYGVHPSQVNEAKKLLSDARRIAVSESNNALREANKEALGRSGIVEAAFWQVSGRHGGLKTSPDECDVLAETNAYNLGAGMYPPEFWPLAPHPYCACTQGGPVKLRDPNEWTTPKPEAEFKNKRANNSIWGATRKHAQAQGWTERRIQTVRAKARTSIMLPPTLRSPRAQGRVRSEVTKRTLPPTDRVQEFMTALEAEFPDVTLASGKVTASAKKNFVKKALAGNGATNELRNAHQFGLFQARNKAIKKARPAGVTEEVWDLAGNALGSHLDSWSGSSSSLGGQQIKKAMQRRYKRGTHYHNGFLDEREEARRRALGNLSDPVPGRPGDTLRTGPPGRRVTIPPEVYDQIIEANRAFTEALYRWAGVETITVRRGVSRSWFTESGQGAIADEVFAARGQPVSKSVATNSIASWSKRRSKAKQFGSYVFEYEVSVSEILTGYTHDSLYSSNEWEMLVFGGIPKQMRIFYDPR
jgi:hypothetical protein